MKHFCKYLYVAAVFLLSIYMLTYINKRNRKIKTYLDTLEYNKAYNRVLARLGYEEHDKTNRTVTSPGIKPSEHDRANANKICDIKSAAWTKNSGKFHVPGDDKDYFHKIAGLKCLKEAVDFLQKTISNQTIDRCKCKPGWYGTHCTIPASAKYSNLKSKTQTIVPISDGPVRRVINVFPFNIEFAMLEARFHEIGDLVDAFVILESNYTAYGDAKPLYLLERLTQGYYRHVSCKIVHVFLNYFPPGAKKNGWIVEAENRNYIGTQGLKHQLSGVEDDDLILLNDADEVPSREVILFLKLHRGYPEPISIQYRSHLYGFFWTNMKAIQVLQAAVTYRLVKDVFQHQIYSIRSFKGYKLSANPTTNKLLQLYLKQPGINFNHWELGCIGNNCTDVTNTGWHCSWCYNPEGIRVKLVSAQNGDFPRWGDYPEKRNLTYITSLIKKGNYFDDKKSAKPTDSLQKYYAPKFFFENFEKYKHLLVNPYL